MTRGVAVTTERRKVSRDGVTAALKRLDSETLADLRAEDEKYRNHDKKVWLADYSLEQHHVELAELLLEMGEVRGVGDTDKAVRTSSGLNHDLGKKEASCFLYRLNRKLTPREVRIVRAHPKHSARMVREKRERVRSSDTMLRKILRWVEMCVRWHDRPWRVFYRWLRVITWDLRFADSYLARSEKRETPSIPHEDALESGIQWVLRETPLYIRVLYWREINGSIRVLRQVVTARLTT